MAMTPAERQRKRRARLKETGMNQIFVRGEGGELDERIRVAFAVQDLALNEELPPELTEKIISRSVEVLPARDQVTRKYIRKLVSEFLTQN